MINNDAPSSDPRDKDNDSCRTSDNAPHRHRRGVRVL